MPLARVSASRHAPEHQGAVSAERHPLALASSGALADHAGDLPHSAAVGRAQASGLAERRRTPIHVASSAACSRSRRIATPSSESVKPSGSCEITGHFLPPQQRLRDGSVPFQSCGSAMRQATSTARSSAQVLVTVIAGGVACFVLLPGSVRASSRSIILGVRLRAGDLEAVRELTEAVRQGGGKLAKACRKLGVPLRTMYTWVEQSERDGSALAAAVRAAVRAGRGAYKSTRASRTLCRNDANSTTQP